MFPFHPVNFIWLNFGSKPVALFSTHFQISFKPHMIKLRSQAIAFFQIEYHVCMALITPAKHVMPSKLETRDSSLNNSYQHSEINLFGK